MAELSATNILNQNIYNGQIQYWEMVKKNYQDQSDSLLHQAEDLATYISGLEASNPYSPDLQRLKMMANNIAITQQQLQPLVKNAEKHIEIAQQAAQRLGGGRGGW